MNIKNIKLLFLIGLTGNQYEANNFTTYFQAITQSNSILNNSTISSFTSNNNVTTYFQGLILILLLIAVSIKGYNHLDHLKYKRVQNNELCNLIKSIIKDVINEIKNIHNNKIDSIEYLKHAIIVLIKKVYINNDNEIESNIKIINEEVKSIFKTLDMEITIAINKVLNIMKETEKQVNLNSKIGFHYLKMARDLKTEMELNINEMMLSLKNKFYNLKNKVT